MRATAFSPPACAIAGALSLLLGSGAAEALSFNLSFAPETSAQARQGFVDAAAQWSARLGDDVAIDLTLSTGALSTAGTLAEATPLYVGLFYSDLRTRLVSHATSAVDLSAVASLPNSMAFSRLINHTSDSPYGSGSPTPYVDPTSIGVRLTAANARVLGLAVNGSGSLGCAVACDARIRVSTDVAYDYDASDGIAAGQYDFVGIAAHEIGHALGFASGVDGLDSGPLRPAGSYNTVTPLDLFRYSALSTAEGVIDFTADARPKYFSIDGGRSVGPEFARGVLRGDGSAASHWRDGDATGVMRPIVRPGVATPITGADLSAFDAIGWTLAAVSPVPEPQHGALFALGLLTIGALQRRRSPARGAP